MVNQFTFVNFDEATKLSTFDLRSMRFEDDDSVISAGDDSSERDVRKKCSIYPMESTSCVLGKLVKEF